MSSAVTPPQTSFSFSENIRNGDPINGFGAEISKSNLVARLRVRQKGSELKLATTGTPGFSGKFAYSSTSSPVAFSGVFVTSTDESVHGYGSLQLSPTSSRACHPGRSRSESK